MNPEPEPFDTVVESASAADREDAYRLRHAELHEAGSFVRLVAEGGMGAILEVDTTEPPSGPVRRAIRSSAAESSGVRALKLLKNELLSSPEAAARFRRELLCHRRLWAKLLVPRLVPCLRVEAGSDARLMFGLFPFFEHGSLGDFLDRDGSMEGALTILADALEGLQALHGHGYVHRDFHPSNIFVAEEGGRLRGLLGDLGVGTFLHPNTLVDQAVIDGARSLRVGHPGYVGAAAGGSFEADLFSVGATLFRIVAHRNPPPTRGDLGIAAALPPADELPADLAQLHRAAGEVIARLTRSGSATAMSARQARESVLQLLSLLPQPGALGEDARPNGATPTRLPRGGGDGAGRRRAAGAVKRAMPNVARAGLALAIGVGLWWRGQSLETTAATAVPTAAPTFEPRLSPVVARPSTAPVAASDAPVRPYVPSAREVGAIDRALREQAWQTAERGLGEILGRSPTDPAASARMALVLARQGRIAEAIEVAEGALREHPRRGDLRLTVARLLSQSGEHAAARSVLDAAPASSTLLSEIRAQAVTLGQSKPQYK